MKAIVHIGSPKVGSSSIQEFLIRNQDELAKRGFRYHRNVPGRLSHYEYPLAAMARTGATLWGESERIRYEARTPEEAAASTEHFAKELETFSTRFKEPVAIFSSEHMMPWLKKPEQVQALHDMFANNFDEVKYVVYFRSQFDAIGSRYSERIKRGEHITFDAFVDRQLKHVNYFKIVRRWANVVGKPQFAVRLLDRTYLKGGDLLQDFCHVSGIDPTGLEVPPRENEALSAPGAECLRVLNSLVPEIHPEGGHNPLRYGLLDAVIRHSQGLPKIVMNDAQRARIDEACAESNEKLQNQFFRRRGRLFAPPSSTHVAMDPLDLQEKALEIMAKVLFEIRRGELRELSEKEIRHSFIADHPMSQAAE